MQRVAIIGGGLSGLSSAVYLSDAGFQVDLFEASPKLGGRAYSFSENNDEIDNGQHIMMGCYNETLRFLSLIGSLDKIDVQKKLHITFIDKEKGLTPLSTGSKLYPFNLLSAMLNFRALSFGERLGIIKLLSKLIILRSASFKNISIKEWLRREGQSERSIRAFWEILSVGILNTDLSKASAGLFVQTLKKIFLKGNRAASIVLPATDLSSMYCRNASEFIIKKGGCILLSKPVESLEIKNDRVTKILFKDSEFADFDFVISSVPPFALSRIIPKDLSNEMSLMEFNYSPILSVHIWLKENRFKEKFYGLIDSPVHWVFNHEKHITLVISNAGTLLGIPNEELMSMVKRELKTFFYFFEEDEIAGYKIIKEKRATFIPSPDILAKRPKAQSRIKNLFLSGDWTDTGLSATIEGAVQSGRFISDILREAAFGK